MFGGLGKAIGGGFKSAGKNVKGALTGKGGGGGINAGPSGGFMSRFKQAAPTALNNAAQAFGSPATQQTAQMTSGMMRRPEGPPGQTGIAPPMQGGINTGPSSPMGGVMPGAANMASGMFGGSSFMSPGSGGGGLWNPHAPKLDPTTNQYSTPENPFGSIFSKIYGNMGNAPGSYGQTPNRPQMYY